MKQILIFLATIQFFNLLAQNSADLDLWGDHLSYKSVMNVYDDGNSYYCQSQSGIFIYDKESYLITKLSKVNGLSDVTISASAYDSVSGSIIIAYVNGNIDIITKTGVENFPHLKQKVMMADKRINAITIYKDNAYFATNFGIIVFDLIKKEFSDTYIIGNDGMYSKILSVEIYKDSLLFASTENGLKYAYFHNTVLSDYNNWNRLDILPTGEYKCLRIYNEKMYFFRNNTEGEDSVFAFSNNSIEYVNSFHSLKSIDISNEKILFSTYTALKVYDKDFVLKINITPANSAYNDFNSAKFTTEDELLICTNNNGLFIWDTRSSVFPTGPYRNIVSNISYSNGEIYAALGRREYYRDAAIGIYKDGKWENHINQDVFDAISVIGGHEENTFYYGTHLYGLIEAKDIHTVSAVYNKKNGAFPDVSLDSDLDRTTISGLAYDDNGNLWMSNWVDKAPFSVLTPEKNIYSYVPKNIGGCESTLYLGLDSYNRKWSSCAQHIYVFDENGTLENTYDDDFKSFEIRDDESEFASEASVIVEDLDKQLWIGTNAGIAIYLNHDEVFEDAKPTLTRIKVEENDEIGYLLGGENILSIAIDGGNRKWVGTEKSGVFLLSEDGRTQLKNFTFENSPMLSNTVYSIAIDGNSGEVYFATEAGIVSYRSDGADESESMSSVYAYPNPVRESYSGPIFIKGLMRNTTVKITDVNGNLVYETISNGGIASWNGNNLWGNRVATGVYLIFCSDENGEETAVSKLLFIN